MTTYAKVAGGKVAVYPYTLQQLRKDNPDVSFPRAPNVAALLDHGVVVVEDSAVPAPSDPTTKNVVEGTPALVAGRWTQTWVEVDADASDVAQRRAAADNQAVRDAVSADSFVSAFVAMTPADVEAYINNNTSNLAAARALLKKMGIMLLLLARKEYVNGGA